MITHTPGPWRVEHGWVRSSNHRAVACIDYCRDEQEANARLIAASPDLLAALQEVAELQGSVHAPVGSLWGRVNAAIAKATGVDDLREPDARQSEIARARALYDKCDKP